MCRIQTKVSFEVCITKHAALIMIDHYPLNIYISKMYFSIKFASESAYKFNRMNCSGIKKEARIKSSGFKGLRINQILHFNEKCIAYHTGWHPRNFVNIFTRVFRVECLYVCEVFDRKHMAKVVRSHFVRIAYIEV